MDQLKITIIGTKFDDGKLKLFRFKKETEEKKETDVLNQVETKKEPTETDVDEFLEEDNEFDIPAFLRKK